MNLNQYIAKLQELAVAGHGELTVCHAEGWVAPYYCEMVDDNLPVVASSRSYLSQKYIDAADVVIEGDFIAL